MASLFGFRIVITRLEHGFDVIVEVEFSKRMGSEVLDGNALQGSGLGALYA